MLSFPFCYLVVICWESLVVAAIFGVAGYSVGVAVGCWWCVMHRLDLLRLVPSPNGKTTGESPRVEAYGAVRAPCPGPTVGRLFGPSEVCGPKSQAQALGMPPLEPHPAKARATARAKRRARGGVRATPGGAEPRPEAPQGQSRGQSRPLGARPWPRLRPRPGQD